MTHPASLAFLILVIPVPTATANVTVDYYSLLLPIPTVVPPFGSGVISETIAGISSVSVQADGETVYVATVVATLEAIMNGTSTLATVFSTPRTTICTY